MTRATHLSLFLLLFAATSAVADEGHANKDAERARKAFFDGSKHYNLGKFQKALEEFEAAYEAKPDPVFLFNIGQCHRFLHNTNDALFAYRRFLGSVPDAPNRAEVERFIAQLEEEAKQVDLLFASQPHERRAGPLPPVTNGTPAPAKQPVLPAADRSIAADERAVPLSVTPPTSAPIYKKWWLWTAIGGVIAAGAIATAITVTTPQNAPIPNGDLPAMRVPF